jgi:hypothetical protein
MISKKQSVIGNKQLSLVKIGNNADIPPKKEPLTINTAQEDFEDADESEIDGEDRPNDRVNMIPNSKFNRNKGGNIPKTT